MLDLRPLRKYAMRSASDISWISSMQSVKEDTYAATELYPCVIVPAIIFWRAMSDSDLMEGAYAFMASSLNEDMVRVCAMSRIWVLKNCGSIK